MLRGVVGRGRDVLQCSGTRLVGETAAGVGCRLPRPGDRDRHQAIVMSDVEAHEVAHGNPFDWNLVEVSEAHGQKCAEALQESSEKRF